MARDAVEVEGVDDVLAKLGRLPAVAQREVDEVLRDVTSAAAVRIRRDAPRAGRQAAAAARSVHAEGTAIVGGGPFFMGSVFGGQGRPTTQQFRPYDRHGRWFFPSLTELYPEALEQFGTVVDAVAREWGVA